MYKLNVFRPAQAAIFSFILIAFFCVAVRAQQPGAFSADRDRAIQLVNAKNFAEALPILERLAVDKQADGQVFLGLGIVKWNLQDPSDKAKWRQTRLAAKAAFLKAKDLGVSIPEIDLLIASVGETGGDKGESSNPQAQAAMEEAFPAFAARDYEKAAAAYERAATLDPTHYEAALYTGNTYFAMRKHDQAAIWFANAITIDPNRETAHRYWADSLWKSGKETEAVEKFFDAVISEPYSSAAWRGITQYAQAKNISLAHARIKVPVDFASGEGKTNITLGNLLGGKEDDGGFAWTGYGISRAVWQTDKDGKLSKDFAAAYPAEKVYRHSLAEEVHAFRMVLTLIKDDKKAKKLDPSLAALKKLDAEGLLESWILFARADEGVRRDYPAYRSANRDKLRRYLAEYIMKNGGEK
jgi:tetratricopeptide (TPR) repeat protein